jgi:hypothetical protein
VQQRKGNKGKVSEGKTRMEKSLRRKETEGTKMLPVCLILKF